MKTGVLNRLGVARRAGQLALLLCALPPALQAQFGYRVENGSVTITRYTGPGGALTIPDTIQGLPVTSIGAWAFKDRTSLTGVTIPDSVTKVESYAFFGCTGLTSITIPESVTSIGYEAFYGCSGLTSITIPNSVTSIGEYAFFQCTGLTDVSILNGATTIGGGVFSGCGNLTYVKVGNGAMLLQGDYPVGALVIQATVEGLPVTHLGDGIYSDRYGLTSVTIPDSVTWIGGGAFFGCIDLTSIIIPEGVTWIGGGAFSGCTGLTNVTIPKGVTSIQHGTFWECTGLTNVTIPKGVTSIRPQAFSGCTGLTDITLPEGVTSIEYGAFWGCTGLTTITIPDSVTSILEMAFSDCSGLTNVYFEGEVVWRSDPFGGTPATIYYLPGSAGWGPTYFGRPTMLWLPRIETCAFQNDQFICTVRWGGHRTVALDVCTDLAEASWSSVGTNTVSNGTAAFTDLQAAVRSASFYRLREITPPRGAITVTGEVGEVYVIESTTDVESDFWLTRGWLELATPTATWTDPVPVDAAKTFYRAVKVNQPWVQTIPNMVWIPPGRFVMGSPETERWREDREGPQTRVTLTRGFWMGKCEVTVGEYFAVMGQVENPGELDWPVAGVSWDDAVAYCQRLTEQERAAGRIGANSVYRLPTEAEWEYACRAGTTTRYSFGDALGCTAGIAYCPLLDPHMWWFGNGGPGRVGQKLPNPWGLHDAHGNVFEWCQDWWSDTLPGGMVVDPQGPTTGSSRVMRGGMQSGGVYFGYDIAMNCRSASRGHGDPGDPGHSFSHRGFRVVLAPAQ